MLWARLIRGTSSMEREVTPRSARLWARSAFLYGASSPMRIEPLCIEAARSGAGARTTSTASAELQAWVASEPETTRAPAFS